MDFICKDLFNDVKSQYDNFIEYFPIITSVIEKKQDGYILKDKDTLIIVHKFGFAYILGKDTDFLLFITTARKLLANKIPKLRLYDLSRRLNNIAYFEQYISYRTKLILSTSIDVSDNYINRVENMDIDFTNLFDLDLCSRYWNKCEDFKANSFGVIDSKIEGICYSAAVSDKYTEIDVLVKEHSRGKQLGTKLVKYYIDNILKNRIVPLWDCYSNNEASLALALKNGFEKKFDYNYYNIER